MPAPNLETLFEIETPVEEACKSIFAADGLSLLTPRSAEERTTPRLECRFEVGSVTGHRFPLGQSAVLDAWNAQLVFRAVTDRNANPEFHAGMRAKVRMRMQYFQNKLTPVLLPFHVLTSILEAGTSPSLDNQLDQDISEIAFACIVCIRSDAWPEM